MKYLTLFLLLASTQLSAQNSMKTPHEVATSIEYMQLKNTYRLQSSISFGWHLGRHILRPEIVFSLKTDHPESNPSPKVSGLGFHYVYQIPSLYERLSFEVVSRCRYQLYDNTWTANYFADERYVDVATSSMEHFMSLDVGYGFRFRLLKNLYIEKFITAGHFHSSLRSGRTISDAPVPNDIVVYDFRRYGSSGWFVSGGLAMKYVF